MKSLRLPIWTAGLALLALTAPIPLTPGRAAPAAPVPEPLCWSIKTTICSDCAEADSKYCDPRSDEGPFATCLQELKSPCPGFTCSDVQASMGPPCN